MVKFRGHVSHRQERGRDRKRKRWKREIMGVMEMKQEWRGS